MLYKPTSNRFFATISYKKSPELCALGLFFLMLYDAELEVRVHLCPLCYWRNDAELYDLVAHLAEVLVRLSEACLLLLSASRQTDKEGQYPFDRPYYLLIDMQTEGSWVGKAIKSELPVEMEIDWVKMYDLVE